MTRWIPLVVAAPSHGGLRRQGSRAGMELPAGAGANGNLFRARPRLLAAGTPFQELVWGNPPGLDEINSTPGKTLAGTSF